MDSGTRAYWSAQAEHHERQAEMWLRFAERQDGVLASCRSTPGRFRDPEHAEVGERYERAVEVYARACRQMAADHLRMAALCRATAEAPWPAESPVKPND
jgi:hypothetical protein